MCVSVCVKERERERERQRQRQRQRQQLVVRGKPEAVGSLLPRRSGD